ncbi:MAG: GNAT family N-acetyltransferase [Tepidisphaeraceae bacterium]
MNLQSIREQLDLERRTLSIDGHAIEILPLVTRLRSADGSRHSILFSSLTNDNADAAIAEEAAHYRALGAEVEWKAYAHDKPADLLQRLSRHGFEIGPLETVLVLDLHDRPAWMNDAANEVIRVENPDQVKLFRKAAAEIFQKDYELTANELLAGIRSGSRGHLGYIALDGNIAASIGRLYTQAHSAFGGLYGGGTLKSHRGRGLYRAVVAARARDAAQMGARYLIVDALPTSRPILEKLGFVRLTDTWPCVLRLGISRNGEGPSNGR